MPIVSLKSMEKQHCVRSRLELLMLFVDELQTVQQFKFQCQRIFNHYYKQSKFFKLSYLKNESCESLFLDCIGIPSSKTKSHTMNTLTVELPVS